MRFHNTQFIPFVNNIIKFETYKLPQITGICDGRCKYTHDNHIEPYIIFQVPSLRTNDESIIDKIISYMNDEIVTNNYLPNNFIFPADILLKYTNTIINIINIKNNPVDK